jgi:hypothetical protein
MKINLGSFDEGANASYSAGTLPRGERMAPAFRLASLDSRVKYCAM